VTLAPVARRVVVHGHVQGVFFRDATRRRAEAAGVTGWVSNRADGAVEAMFEGAAEAVERLVAFMREGPRGAAVDSTEVFEVEPAGLEGFQVR
jgi:acylphosphatase